MIEKYRSNENKNKDKLEVILEFETIAKFLYYTTKYNIRNRFGNIDKFTTSELTYFLHEILKFSLVDKLVKDNIPILDIIKFLLYAGADPYMLFIGENYNSIKFINTLITNVETGYLKNDLDNPEYYEELIYKIRTAFIEAVDGDKVEGREEKMQHT